MFVVHIACTAWIKTREGEMLRFSAKLCWLNKKLYLFNIKVTKGKLFV